MIFQLYAEKYFQLEKRIPADADIFIGYATTPGYVSWRNSSRGSWYIESIIEIFKRDAYHEDLLSMMTKVVVLPLTNIVHESCLLDLKL